MPKTKIAAIQLTSSQSVDENLQQVESMLCNAAATGAELIVLPEMFPIMGKTEKDKVAAAEKIGNGKIQSFLSALAKQYNIWIVGGTIPIIANDPNKIRAACLVYNDNGRLAARYDKIHLFDATLSNGERYYESETTEPGNDIVVVDTPFGKLGLAVCYDMRFPNLFEQLHHRGAEIIAIPAAFTAKTGAAHWHLLTRSRAIDTFSYVIASNQVGTHANQRQTYGRSLIVDPWGSVISELNEDKPGIIYADIDLAKIQMIRESIPTKIHRRIL